MSKNELSPNGVTIEKIDKKASIALAFYSVFWLQSWQNTGKYRDLAKNFYACYLALLDPK